MSGPPSSDSLAALRSIVAGSLRALRAAVADLSFSSEGVRRVADEAATASGALARLDRVLASLPAAVAPEPPPSPSTFAMGDVRELLCRLRRLTEPDGWCPDCGGVRH